MITANSTLDPVELETILAYVDGLSASARRRSENRKFVRKRLRIPCTVSYIAADGSSVLQRAGRMRDICRSGLGLLVKSRLSPDTQVRVTATLQETHAVDFTGTVTFSRSIRLGWYAVGIRFASASDERLVPPEKPGRIHAIELE